jgi:hypothetical protein
MRVVWGRGENRALLKKTTSLAFFCSERRARAPTARAPRLQAGLCACQAAGARKGGGARVIRAEVELLRRKASLSSSSFPAPARPTFFFSSRSPPFGRCAPHARSTPRVLRGRPRTPPSPRHGGGRRPRRLRAVDPPGAEASEREGSQAGLLVDSLPAQGEADRRRRAEGPGGAFAFGDATVGGLAGWLAGWLAGGTPSFTPSPPSLSSSSPTPNPLSHLSPLSLCPSLFPADHPGL